MAKATRRGAARGVEAGAGSSEALCTGPAEPGLLEKLHSAFPLRRYSDVAAYLSLLMEGHLHGVVGKEVLTGGVYAGSVLLQAMRMAKEDEVLGEGLSVREGFIEASFTREESIAILTAGNMGVSVKLINKAASAGKIVSVQAREVVEVEQPVETIYDRANRLIEMSAPDSEDLFADE
jgi:hypothetical protein